jgi:altronate hydrolase
VGPSGDNWLVAVDLPAGHKLAAQPIGAGELVVKFGFPIGVATRPIASGEHVHTHNLSSRQMPAVGEETA